MFKYKEAASRKKNIGVVTKQPWFKFSIFGLVVVLILLLSFNKILFKFSFGNKLAEVMTYGIVAIGFSYLLGYAGLSSLGTAGFVGIGAYVTAFFTKVGVKNGYLKGSWSVFIILIIAVVISLILGLVVGFASLRIEGLFLAILTLGLSEVLFQVFVNADKITDGVNGITTGFVKIIGNLKFTQLSSNIVIAVLLVLVLILTSNVQKSVTGRAMLAMKNSTSAAQAMGISLLKYRLMAFMLSSVYCAIAGVFLITTVRYTDPKTWSIMFSLNILAACIFGGTRNLWGIMFGTFIVFGLDQMFLSNIQFLRNNSWLTTAIIGTLLIVLVLFYKGGIIQLIGDIKKLIKKITFRRRVKKYGYDEEQ